MRKKRTQGEFGFVNWGGRRRGAGRKPKDKRAGVAHDRRPRLSRHHPVLVTLRVAAGLRSLRAQAEHAVVLRALGASSAHEGFRVIEYTVQSNHLHLIVEASNHAALARGMIGLTVRLARGLNRLPWEGRSQSRGTFTSSSSDGHRHASIRTLEEPLRARCMLGSVQSGAAFSGAGSSP